MTAITPKVGFIGLGCLAKNVAGRYLAAGYGVCGHDGAPDQARPLVAEGLDWCDSPRAVAQAAHVIFTAFPDDGALAEVASGSDGVLAGLGAGKSWVDMSTVSPQASRDLAERVRARGAWLHDAWVSGRVPQAQAETLAIMVGGDDAGYRRVERHLQVLGKPVHIGTNGQGLILSLAIDCVLKRAHQLGYGRQDLAALFQILEQLAPHHDPSGCSSSPSRPNLS